MQKIALPPGAQLSLLRNASAVSPNIRQITSNIALAEGRDFAHGAVEGKAMRASFHSRSLSAFLRYCVWLAFVITAPTAAAQSPEEGGPRRWETFEDRTRVYDAPSVDAEVISVLPVGTVLSSLGCVDADEQLWCRVRPFRGGVSGYAAAAWLRPAKGPDGSIPTGVDDSDSRARQRDFDAEGQVSCAQERGQSMRTCTASVARSGGGDATVVVTFPNGFVRELYFVHGEFVRASATMSGVGTDISWRRENAFHFVRVDDQRFELPHSLIFGF